MREILDRSPIFSAFGPDERVRIGEKMERRTFAAGAVAIESGSTGDALHIVVDGLFKVTRLDAESGATQMLATIGKGEVFGETSLLVDSPRAARVVAMVDSETAAMPRALFEDVLKDFPVPAARFLREIARLTVERLRKSLAEVIAASGFDPEAIESDYHVRSLVRSGRRVRLHLAGGTTISGRILRIVHGLGPDEIVVETRKDEEAIVPRPSVLFWDIVPK